MTMAYSHAAICKRGHVLYEEAESRPTTKRCPECGARVLYACSQCDQHIRGIELWDGMRNRVDEDYRRPSFCDECGAPFPWIDRRGRIFELENLLDGEDLDPAAELEAREQLQALAAIDTAAANGAEQRRRWERVRQLAPGFLERSSAIVETVISAEIRRQLGLL